MDGFLPEGIPLERQGDLVTESQEETRLRRLGWRLIHDLCGWIANRFGVARRFGGLGRSRPNASEVAHCVIADNAEDADGPFAAA
jgi:hypothetical protein